MCRGEYSPNQCAVHAGCVIVCGDVVFHRCWPVCDMFVFVYSLFLFGLVVRQTAARNIKKLMDKKFGPHWHCVIGENFGMDVTHQKKNLILLLSLIHI